MVAREGSDEEEALTLELDVEEARRWLSGLRPGEESTTDGV